MRRSLVRPALVVAAAVVCTVIGSAVSAAPAATSPSLPPSLGIPVDDAQGFALDAVASGGVNWWPARTAWSRATPEARVALVNGTLAWSKAFVMSPAFAAVYAERRTATKPEPPESKGSVAAELAAQRAEQRRGMDEMRAALAQMPADQRAAMKEVIAQTEAMLAQQARDPEVQQMMRQGIEAERTERQQRYQESLATWQQDFPADPRRLIALRLQAAPGAAGLPTAACRASTETRPAWRRA